MEIKIELPHVGESVTEAIIDKWVIKIDELVGYFQKIHLKDTIFVSYFL